MSDPTKPAAGEAVGTAVTAQNWPEVAGQVVGMVLSLAAFIQPGAGAALMIATKILQGALALEPAAVALFNQIKSGTPPTPDQLKAFADQYEADYQTLHQAIQTQLSKLPPTPA